MRILLVSDLHQELKQVDWVMSVAGDYEVVVVACDHLDLASIVAPDAQFAGVLEYLARIATKTTVIACSENHDLNARNDLGERAAVAELVGDRKWISVYHAPPDVDTDVQQARWTSLAGIEEKARLPRLPLRVRIALGTQFTARAGTAQQAPEHHVHHAESAFVVEIRHFAIACFATTNVTTQRVVRRSRRAGADDTGVVRPGGGRRR